LTLLRLDGVAKFLKYAPMDRRAVAAEIAMSKSGAGDPLGGGYAQIAQGLNCCQSYLGSNLGTDLDSIVTVGSLGFGRSF
jgi:hypothetical protein